MPFQPLLTTQWVDMNDYLVVVENIEIMFPNKPEQPEAKEQMKNMIEKHSALILTIHTGLMDHDVEQL